MVEGAQSRSFKSGFKSHSANTLNSRCGSGLVLRAKCVAVMRTDGPGPWWHILVEAYFWEHLLAT